MEYQIKREGAPINGQKGLIPVNSAPSSNSNLPNIDEIMLPVDFQQFSNENSRLNFLGQNLVPKQEQHMEVGDIGLVGTEHYQQLQVKTFGIDGGGKVNTKRSKALSSARTGYATARGQDRIQRAPLPTTLDGLYKDGMIRSSDLNIFDERMNRITIKSSKRSSASKINSARNLTKANAQTMASVPSIQPQKADGNQYPRVQNAAGGGGGHSLLSLTQRQRRVQKLSPAQTQTFSKGLLTSVTSSIQHQKATAQFSQSNFKLAQRQSSRPQNRNPQKSSLDLDYHFQAQSNDRQLNQVQSNLKFFRQKSNMHMQSQPIARWSQDQGQNMYGGGGKAHDGVLGRASQQFGSIASSQAELRSSERKNLQSARVEGRRTMPGTLTNAFGNSSGLNLKALGSRSYFVKNQQNVQTGEHTGRGPEDGTALNSQRSNLLIGAKTKTTSIDDYQQQTFDPARHTVEKDQVGQNEKAEDPAPLQASASRVMQKQNSNQAITKSNPDAGAKVVSRNNLATERGLPSQELAGQIQAEAMAQNLAEAEKGQEGSSGVKTGDKVVVLVVQKQEQATKAAPSGVISPQDNWGDKEAYRTFSSKLGPEKEAVSSQNQGLQKSKSRYEQGQVDMVAKAGVAMLHGETVKARPLTSKTRVNLAKQCYKIPSISKCLEFEILPRNQTLLKNLCTQMVNHPLGVNLEQTAHHLLSDKPKTKAGGRLSAHPNRTRQLMKFDKDKHSSQKEVGMSDDPHHSSFTADQQVEGASVLNTGVSRSQRAGTMTVRDSIVAGKETIIQMQAKYDKSSINSVSARKLDKDSSTKKEAHKQVPATTCRKALACAYPNQPASSFSQIPITNLELDVGTAVADPQTARIAAQYLQKPAMLPIGSNYGSMLKTEHQSQLNSARVRPSKFVGGVQNQLAMDQQNQYLSLMNRVQQQNMQTNVASNRQSLELLYHDPVSQLDDNALSPFERDQDNNLVKGRKIGQAQAERNWRQALPAHLKQQLPAPSTKTTRRQTRNQSKNGEFPRYKKGNPRAGSHEKGRRPKRVPVKVNMNIDYLTKTNNNPTDKGRESSHAPSAALPLGCSPTMFKASEQDGQSLFMMTPKAGIPTSFPMGFPFQNQPDALGDQYNASAAEQLCANNLFLPVTNSRSKSPVKGRGLTQAVSSGVASTLVDRGETKHGNWNLGLNKDLQEESFLDEGPGGQQRAAFKHQRKSTHKALIFANQSPAHMSSSGKKVVVLQQQPTGSPLGKGGSGMAQANLSQSQQQLSLQSHYQPQHRFNLPVNQVVAAPGQSTGDTRGHERSSRIVRMATEEAALSLHNADADEVRLSSDLYQQIPAMAKREQQSLKNTQSTGNLRSTERQGEEPQLTKSNENGVSAGTLQLAQHGNLTAAQNVRNEKKAMGSSPGVSLGKASSARQSLDGLHQVDNCYAEPKLNTEDQEAPKPVRKASRRQLLNQIAFGASDRLHSAKLNQCHLHRSCKCASAKFQRPGGLNTPPDAQMRIQEVNEGDASGEDAFSDQRPKKEAFKLDLHCLSGQRSPDEPMFKSSDVIAAAQPAAQNSPEAAQVRRNTERSLFGSGSPNVGSRKPSTIKSQSPIIHKRIAIPTGHYRRSRANQVIVNNSKLGSSRNQDIQQILSTNGDQTSRIEPLNAIRGNSSPEEQIEPIRKSKHFQKPSAAGSDIQLLDQMKDLENLADKDLFTGVVDQLQKMTSRRFQNMKPIQLTQFDVKLQIPKPVEQNGSVTISGFSPNRRQQAFPSSVPSSQQKSINLGASIAIMGPQVTKTITQSMQGTQTPNVASPAQTFKTQTITSANKQFPKTRAKSSKQSKKATKLATIESELARDMSSIALNDNLTQALRTSQIILKRSAEKLSNEEQEELLQKVNQIGNDLNSNMETHIVNSVRMKNQEAQCRDQLAVQIEQSSLELLLQTYQNLQSFYEQFNVARGNQVGESNSQTMGQASRNMTLANMMRGPVPIEGQFAESAPGTLIPVSARDGFGTLQERSDGASPSLSPNALGNERSGDLCDSSPGQSAAPMSPIGPKGHLAIQLLKSSSPRNRTRVTMRKNSSTINIMTAQDPSLQVQIIKNDKNVSSPPPQNINPFAQQSPSQRTLLQSSTHIQQIPQLVPRIQQTSSYRQIEIPQAQPSTIHLQTKNKRQNSTKNINYKNKALVVKQMPILQIVNESNLNVLNRDMVNHNFQMLPPQFKVDPNQQKVEKDQAVVRNKHIVTAKVSQTKLMETSVRSGITQSLVPDAQQEISRNVKGNQHTSGLFMKLSKPSQDLSRFDLSGQALGTTNYQVSHHKEQSSGSNINVPNKGYNFKHVEITENISELKGAKDSHGSNPNLLIQNEEDLFSPQSGISLGGGLSQIAKNATSPRHIIVYSTSNRTSNNISPVKQIPDQESSRSISDKDDKSDNIFQQHSLQDEADINLNMNIINHKKLKLAQKLSSSQLVTTPRYQQQQQMIRSEDDEKTALTSMSHQNFTSALNHQADKTLD